MMISAMGQKSGNYIDELQKNDMVGNKENVVYWGGSRISKRGRVSGYMINVKYKIVRQSTCATS